MEADYFFFFFRNVGNKYSAVRSSLLYRFYKGENSIFHGAKTVREIIQFKNLLIFIFIGPTYPLQLLVSVFRESRILLKKSIEKEFKTIFLHKENSINNA